MSTIKDIAREAGVSYSTVSRAIKGSLLISAETRGRIMEIAQKLNYLPNASARNLVYGLRDTEQSARRIHVLYEKNMAINDWYFSKIIRGVVDVSSGGGYSTQIASVSDNYEEMLKLFGDLSPRAVTGLILVGDISDRSLETVRKRIPNCVLIDKPTASVSSIYNDNEDGAYRVTATLLKTGCRRIGLIHGVPNHYFTESIIRGYTRALHEAGIEGEPALLAQGDFHLKSGYHAMGTLLELRPAIDAVFSNDEMAIGALRAVKDRGLKVPDDVSIFGFDNLHVSQQTDPRLSTVSVNYEQIAKLAVRRIIDNSAEKIITPVRIIVPVQLILRESTRALELAEPRG